MHEHDPSVGAESAAEALAAERRRDARRPARDHQGDPAMPLFKDRKGAAQALGDYELLDELGDGGMGTTYKARARATGDLVAVKLLSPALVSNEKVLKRF